MDTMNLYLLAVAVSFLLVILLYLYQPTWMVIISLLCFLSSLFYYMMFTGEEVKWFAIVFYAFFVYSWYSWYSKTYLKEESQGLVQAVCVFSMFALFVFFKMNTSVGTLFKWSAALLLIAFVLSKMMSGFVALADHWHIVTYLFFATLLGVGLYLTAQTFPLYFYSLKAWVFGLLNFIIVELNTTPRTVGRVVIAEILVVLFYFYYTSFSKFYFQQHHGTLLMNEPVLLDEVTHMTLQPSFVYNYALSGWFWIDSEPSNKGFMPILNYGEIPNITYSPLQNKLKITIKDQAGTLATVCEIPEVPLQKWNHILVNNNRGILDVFFNGNLYKSIQGIVPYKSNELITTGGVNGVFGEICNVMYFEQPLDITKIKQLYHSFKNYNPPIV